MTNQLTPIAGLRPAGWLDSVNHKFLQDAVLRNHLLKGFSCVLQ